MKNKTTKTITCLLAGLTLFVIAGCQRVTYDSIPKKWLLDWDGVISPSQGYAVSCVDHCRVGISRAISIKPLRDTTGTAVYSGKLDIHYANGSIESNNLKIDVNFSNQKWFGNIDNGGIIAGVFFKNGGITGNFGVIEVTGIIGATQMIGVFRSSGQAGGFNVTRE